MFVQSPKIEIGWTLIEFGSFHIIIYCVLFLCSVHTISVCSIRCRYRTNKRQKKKSLFILSAFFSVYLLLIRILFNLVLRGLVQWKQPNISLCYSISHIAAIATVVVVVVVDVVIVVVNLIWNLLLNFDLTLSLSLLCSVYFIPQSAKNDREWAGLRHGAINSETIQTLFGYLREWSEMSHFWCLGTEIETEHAHTHLRNSI